MTSSASAPSSSLLPRRAPGQPPSVRRSGSRGRRRASLSSRRVSSIPSASAGPPAGSTRASSAPLTKPSRLFSACEGQGRAAPAAPLMPRSAFERASVSSTYPTMAFSTQRRPRARRRPTRQRFRNVSRGEARRSSAGFACALPSAPRAASRLLRSRSHQRRRTPGRSATAP